MSAMKLRFKWGTFHLCNLKLTLYIVLYLKYIIISFTLYSAPSRVDRGKLVLRHSVPHFLPNSSRNGYINLRLCKATSIWLQAWQILSSSPTRANEIFNIFISSTLCRVCGLVKTLHWLPPRFDKTTHSAQNRHAFLIYI